MIDRDAARPEQTIELLAPAGDWDCARAAVENGANAIYFGLDCGFNARFRAKNFGIPDLPELMKFLHRRGVRGYVTMNTLVFPSELPPLVKVVEQIAAAGVDAVLVQDFGVARLVRTICPELEIHASTQMSLTSAETIAVASELALSRVVLARELSVDDIRSIAAETTMPLEVFIHGALCVAYSGQCLTSESLGGRSANRGQCAQACRLPYELVCDGEDRDLGDVRYLLSPQDLAGYDAIAALIAAGVASLKIEGRLKTPEYVANITQQYRRAINQALECGSVTVSDQSRREMELSFSRGFSPGWLLGNDHKQLVPGLSSAKRGIPLGTVLQLNRGRIQVRLEEVVSRGDGLAILGNDESTTEGGRIYSLEDTDHQTLDSIPAGETAWIGFGRNEIDWDNVELNASVFKTDDPKLNKRLRQSFQVTDPVQRQCVDIEAFAVVGQPLRLTGRVGGLEVTVDSNEPLQEARTRPADPELLKEKVARLGGTPFVLREFQARIDGSPMVPMGMLNQLRRDLVEALLRIIDNPAPRVINRGAAAALIESVPSATPETTAPPQLAVLCRNLTQVESVARTDASVIYADFHDIKQYREAVQVARQSAKPIGIATVRMQKPGEVGLLRVLLRHEPDFVLARNLAAIRYFQKHDVPTIADFSMNVANQLSAQWIASLGVQRVTASYDLNRDQLLDLVQNGSRSPWEVVIHQHMPMFHMEHCVFCAVISPGTNKTNCGRPCDRHVVQLRDRVGAEHTLHADVACRNTLYNSQAQSGAELTTDLLRCGIQWFRVELLNEDDQSARSTVELYQQLLRGQLSAQTVWQKLKASNRVGVTRGTLESKRDPLAIL